MSNTKLYPLLKYPGGKESELKYINKALPPIIESYYEPFLGGGAVYFNINTKKYYVNDKSKELMLFYKSVADQDCLFFEKLKDINYVWKYISNIPENYNQKLLNIFYDFYDNKLNEEKLEDKLVEYLSYNNKKIYSLMNAHFDIEIEDFLNTLKKTLFRRYKRMKELSKKSGILKEDDLKDNIEASIKATFYTHLRTIYNNRTELNLSEGYSSAIYFFIRQTCYSSMFRYNNSGGFNVPYGGISYNKMNFDKHLEYFSNKDLIDKFSKTTFGNDDFYKFMEKYEAQKNDFVFVDPPYDTEFSTYANNSFIESDQERLSNYLINICKGNFMLVIKNTDLISSLYKEGTKTANGDSIYISSFNKKYSVSFKNRNDKNAEHLVITNYNFKEE